METYLANADSTLERETVSKIYDWEKNAVPKDKREKLSDEENAIRINVERSISRKLSHWQSLTLLMQQVGAFFGMYSFGWMAQRVGRKPTFLGAFIMAAITTAGVFAYLSKPSDIFWMIPVMGFFQLSLFAGYAIYFPELFPTHLRSTGTSFCYNVGRFVAASGPTVLGILTSQVFTPDKYPPPLNWRYAGVSMCSIFIIGVITLLFARETKDQPLPE
jgi:MFS family permease